MCFSTFATIKMVYILALTEVNMNKKDLHLISEYIEKLFPVYHISFSLFITVSLIF